MIKKVLTIAGSDSSGGAGIQADIKTITAHKMYAMSAITALTAQNTMGVSAISEVDPEFVGKQLDSIFTDIYPDSVKIGMVSSVEIIDVISQKLTEYNAKNIVVDPVMGDNGNLYAGFTPAYVEKMRSLCSAADYILPNETEACYLAELPYPLTKESAFITVDILRTLCPRPVITGITEKGEIGLCYHDGKQAHFRTHENVEGFFCGAGDVFASAFVGCLARGKDEATAIALASDFAAAAIRRSAVEVPDKKYGLNFEAEIFGFLKKLNG